MKKWKKRFLTLLIFCSLLYSCRLVNPVMISMENDLPSESTGESWNGSMKNGKRLPNKGENYRAASYFFTSLGRNGVNSRVRDLSLAVYDSLYVLLPEKKFVYGETGWVSGGKFWPHYTHQNGLVVDYMVPVFRHGKSSRLRTNIFNRWGYAFNFDTTGVCGSYSIDFETLSEHIYLLQQMAPAHHLKIKRIIFTTEFWPYVYRTEKGKLLESTVTFVQKSTWLRHDDHYHVEFEVVK